MSSLSFAPMEDDQERGEKSIVEDDHHVKDDHQKTSRVKLAAVVVVMGGLMAVGAYYHNRVTGALHLLVDWCKEAGWYGPLVLLVVTAFLNTFMLPTFPLMVGSGLIFPQVFGLVLGQFVAVVTIFGGTWLGSMIAFRLGKTLFRQWAEKELANMKWMKSLNDMIERSGWMAVLICRANPLLPAEVFSYVCALTCLTYLDFAIGSAGSLIPVKLWVCITAFGQLTAEFALVEADERKRMMKNELVYLVLSGVLIAVLLLLVVFIRRRLGRERILPMEATLLRKKKIFQVVVMERKPSRDLRRTKTELPPSFAPPDLTRSRTSV